MRQKNNRFLFIFLYGVMAVFLGCDGGNQKTTISPKQGNATPYYGLTKYLIAGNTLTCPQVNYTKILLDPKTGVYYGIDCAENQYVIDSSLVNISFNEEVLVVNSVIYAEETSSLISENKQTPLFCSAEDQNTQILIYKNTDSTFTANIILSNLDTDHPLADTLKTFNVTESVEANSINYTKVLETGDIDLFEMFYDLTTLDGTFTFTLGFTEYSRVMFCVKN